MANPVGIGEHSNIVEAIEGELDMIAKYQDQIDIIQKCAFYHLLDIKRSISVLYRRSISHCLCNYNKTWYTEKCRRNLRCWRRVFLSNCVRRRHSPAHY